MRELQILFDNNRKWVDRKKQKDSNFFHNLSQQQQPKYFWIGCSDSRLPANEIVGLEAEELFVHRNVGGLFQNIDINCLSSLEYAVNFLKIKHVILCGHYGCGAIKAVIEEQSQEILNRWLQNIKDLYIAHEKELKSIQDVDKRCDRLVELNVRRQVHNVCQSSIVQEAWKQQQPLCIHGWIYDLKTGLLQDLDLCISDNDQIE